LNQSQQYFHFDVIKVNAETSQDLMQKHSLLCRLLALKANDKNVEPEQLIRAVYEAITVFKPDLTHDQLLLINQWLDFYKKVPRQTFQQIKKEFNVAMIETTISEHIFNQGLAQGKAEGKLEGRMEGKQEGRMEGEMKGKQEGLEQQIALLKTLHEEGVLSKSRLKKLLLPLETQLQALKH
jgi:predicted transposase YdaD